MRCVTVSTIETGIFHKVVLIITRNVSVVKNNEFHEMVFE